MTRRASSASSTRTDSRTSARSVTASGYCDTRDAATDGIPFASSSPRTILASISELVRKMTTRSDMGRNTPHHRLHLQQDHRHVVVLRGVADKRRDIAQHALTPLLR